MCLARLFRLMDLRTRYTHVFSALASGRSTSWAKLVMGETRGFQPGQLWCQVEPECRFASGGQTDFVN